MKKEGLMFLFSFSIVVLFLLAFSFVGVKSITGDVITGEAITGKAMQGNTNVSINLIGLVNITVYSPQNTTYEFDIAEEIAIDLNVSASNDSVPDAWWFTLIDLTNNVTLNDSVIFTPNITIHPNQNSHSVTVYANNSINVVSSKTVLFDIEINNTAPVISGVSSEILVCENTALTYFFNVTDVDGNTVTIELSNLNPFFLWPVSFSGETSPQKISFYSLRLNKNNVRGGDGGTNIYAETVFASDGQASDSKMTNITIIEINNPPAVENVTTKTIWAFGENRTFYENVDVTDLEGGNQSSGNFTFNLTFLNVEPIFNISEFGVMNFTANSSYLAPNNGSVVYNLTLCVTDRALATLHQNISLCEPQNGTNKTVCQNFSLTVTAQNRAPFITSYSYSTLTFSVLGTTTLIFNVTKSDLDGTVPDAYWYADNSFKERDVGSIYDSFTHTFGCEVSGLHTVKVEVTDGLLDCYSSSDCNASIQWNITVQNVECTPEGAAVGGRGIKLQCEEKWACDTWSVCEDAETGLANGELAGEKYRAIKETCLENKWNDAFCGYQIKECFNANSCNTTFNKPSDLQACYFTEEPGCFDGIKNCHDEGCEFLVDCGGHSEPCPSCSD